MHSSICVNSVRLCPLLKQMELHTQVESACAHMRRSTCMSSRHLHSYAKLRSSQVKLSPLHKWCFMCETLPISPVAQFQIGSDPAPGLEIPGLMVLNFSGQKH